MRRTVLAFLLLLLTSTALLAQGVAVSIYNGTADPTTCRPQSRNVFIRRDTGTMKICTAANTWTALVSGVVNATTVTTTSVSNNAEYRPLFVSSTTNSNQAVKLNASALTYNPSTDTLTVAILNGQANTALSASNATTANGSSGDFQVGSGTLFFVDSSTNSIAFTSGTTTGPVFTRAIGGDPLVWTIDMSLITSGSPRTVAVPDASGTMVLDTATQTLTGKTLTDAKTGGVTPAVSNTTANSCGTTTATITGNNTTGVVTVGATAGTNCTITFTVAAPTRRQCTVTNETTANLSRSTFLTTTTSTVEGTFVAGDKISYVCAVY